MNRYEAWLAQGARENGNGNGKDGPGDLWRNLLQKSPSTGAAIPNLANTLLALRNDPMWIGRLAFDEMLQAAIGPLGPIEDADIIPIHEWLQHNSLTRVGLDTVREAIDGVCRDRKSVV